MKQGSILSYFKVSDNDQKQKRSEIEQKTTSQQIQTQNTPIQNNQLTQKNDEEDVFKIKPRKITKLKITDSDEEELQQKTQTKVEQPTKIEENNSIQNFQFKQKQSTRMMQEEEFEPQKNEIPKKITAPVQKKSTIIQKQTPNFRNEINDEDQLINCDKENQIEGGGQEFDEKTPYWACPEHCKDKQGLRPNEAGYDPSTLYVPPAEYNKLTNCMKQYWTFKSDNFDKIIFLKLGKFYELFFEDAMIGNLYLDLKWMGRKMHTGFPEKCLEKYASLLIDMGLKVVVVEQTETPKQMQERMKDQKTKERIVNREITQILTKGTYSAADQDYQPRYLISIRNHQNKFGIAILDASTNQMALGCILDDDNLNMLKMMLCQIKPQEVIYDPSNATIETLSILRKGYFKPVLTIVSNKMNQWHNGTAYNYLEKSYGEYDQQKWPGALVQFAQDPVKKDLVFSALAGCFSYLQQILLLDDVLQTARFSVYDQSKGIRNSMILDSQSLIHLEILESNLNPNNPEEGSLLKFIDRTSSPFGKRMIKHIICAPLMDHDSINDRLDAIEDMNLLQKERQQFSAQLGKFPDLERLCSKIYKYSVSTMQKKAIFFEDVSLTKMKEFQQALLFLDQGSKMINEIWRSNLNKIKSKRLIRLLTFIKNDKNMEIEREGLDYQNFIYQSDNQVGGVLPNVQEHINDFKNFIIWTGKGKEVPVPAEGVVLDYDRAKLQVKEVKEQFNEILEEVRGQFRDKSIDFVHVKFKYELEISEKLVKGNNKPENFEFTSSKAGFQRFHTREIKDLLEVLEDAENREKEMLNQFIVFVFKQFQEKNKIWDSLINILGELDCLSSLSLISFNSGGVMCRPQLSYANENESFMDITSAWHPCLQMTGVNFIPNDIKLGKYRAEDENKTLLLLTGPNMGGKSTLLRMTCIIPILAQIGCYVPASKCRLSIVDRIFTRIGANDRLVEGKSTFFMEMEETSNAVRHGTSNSLIIMDELGRGTSTYDGVAIAYSILKYLVEQLRCRCLFATHYHILLDEFRQYKQIKYGHMACIMNEETEKVLFLYKLKDGECSNSFGINVAKVVGIKKQIIEVAQMQAKKFDQELANNKYNQINQQYHSIMDSLFYNKNFSSLEILDQLEKSFDCSVKIQNQN